MGALNHIFVFSYKVENLVGEKQIYVLQLYYLCQILQPIVPHHFSRVLKSFDWKFSADVRAVVMLIVENADL